MRFFTKKDDRPAEKASRVPLGMYSTVNWQVHHYVPMPTFNPQDYNLHIFCLFTTVLRCN